MSKVNLERINKLRDRICAITPQGSVVLMEVCGTHTATIARSGIRQMLPKNVRLISGPGCPVCVTSAADIDLAIEFSKLPGAILTSFGDMIRVPGASASLSQARARGSDVRVVYSVYDALSIAEANPQKQVVFESVGFETTAPSVADAIMEAKARRLDNFSVLCMNKTVPEALRALLDMGEVKIDGFILPGHVSAIIGMKPYEFLPAEYGIGGVISGFEAEDVLLSVAALLKQVSGGVKKIENQYSRVVKYEGNKAAVAAMYEVFEPCDAFWRGIGLIPGSGLRIKYAYCEYDAQKRFDIKVSDSKEPPGCRCGDVLRGVIEPGECPLFGRACTPDNPVGPCMVSSEGSCGIWYKERKPA